MNWTWLWYELLYYPAATLSFWLFSLRVRGRRNMPKSGGIIIVANHQCAIDPMLVGIAVRRHIRYLARSTLFKSRVASWFMSSLGAFQLNQESGGKEGLKATLQLLKDGEGVVVFPEGGRTPDGKIHELKPGVMLLVRRANVPVLPVGIAGAFEAWPIWRYVPRAFCPIFLPAGKGGMALVVGKPMPPEHFANRSTEDVLAELHAILSDLHDQAERLRRQ